MILEYAKKSFDIINYTFSGQNKFEMMNNFLEELNQNTMVFTKILTVISIILFNIQTMESIIDFTFPINLRDTVII